MAGGELSTVEHSYRWFTAGSIGQGPGAAENTGEGVTAVVEESVDIGHRVRRIRHARGKSQAVIAGLAGISPGYLSMLERGQRALDRHSLIVKLANALEISPSELTKLPVPAPGNGEMDAAVDAVRRALLAVSYGRPGGLVHPVEALQARVRAVADAQCRCGQDGEVGAALPALIRDLHTSIAAGRDVAELLDLAVLLHSAATLGWLRVAGAPPDLRIQAATLARQTAQHRDTPTALGLAAWDSLHVMLAAGTFDLAQAELDAVTVPTNSPESTQLAGILALSHSLVAAASGRPGEMAAPLDMAAELAERTGEGNAYWMGFGPTNVGQWRMASALELGNHERVATVAAVLRPELNLNRECQAKYWTDYGRALARLPRRRSDAVVALRRAERISPRSVQRNPLARDTLAELLGKAQRDAAGRELHDMARRAGLPT